MSIKKIFLLLSILSFSISNLMASLYQHEEYSINKIGKAEEVYWDVDVPEIFLLKSFHEVDIDAIKGAGELLTQSLSDRERRIQQAILQHEDAKLAFNLACQEYSILLEAGKIERYKGKVSPKTLTYLNLVKNQEEIKNNPFLVFPASCSSTTISHHPTDGLELSYFYLEPYIYDPTQNDFEFAKNLSDELNGPVSHFEQGAHSSSALQEDYLQENYLGERKFYFVDDFEGDKDLEYAYNTYTKIVNGGAGLNDMDVHAYNRMFNFKEFLPTILLKDKKSISTDSASNIVGEMKKTHVYEHYSKQSTLNTSFARLLNHLSIQKVEAGETGVNVEEILSRIWSLIVYDPHEIHNLFTVFCDNEETHGGCFPGHAGRLADFYVKVLRKKRFTREIIYYE